MKKHFLLSGLLICCLLAPALPLTPRANTVFYFSDSNVAVGEELTVTVQSTDLSTVLLKYDPAFFEVTGTGSSYTASNGVVTINGSSANVTFTAKQSGQTGFAVADSSSSNLASSGYTVGAASTASDSGSNTNQTSGSDANASSGSDTSSGQTSDGSQAAEATGTDTSAGADSASSNSVQSSTNPDADYTVDGKDYTLSERFTDAEVPSGFSVIRQEIHGYNFKVLKSDSTSDVLVYIKPSDNVAGSGEFWRYQADGDTISPLYMLTDDEGWVMVETPASMPQAALESATADLGEETAVPVYTLAGQDGKYFFYGRSSAGTTGWYEYDATQGTWEPADETVLSAAAKEPQPAEETPQDTGSSEGEDSEAKETQDETPEEPTEEAAEQEAAPRGFLSKIDRRYLLIGIIFAIALALILVINIVLRRREDAYDEDDIEYDFGKIRLDDEDEAPYRARTRSTQRSRRRDEEDFYDDDLDAYLTGDEEADDWDDESYDGDADDWDEEDEEDAFEAEIRRRRQKTDPVDQILARNAKEAKKRRANTVVMSMEDLDAIRHQTEQTSEEPEETNEAPLQTAASRQDAEREPDVRKKRAAIPFFSKLAESVEANLTAQADDADAESADFPEDSSREEDFSVEAGEEADGTGKEPRAGESEAAFADNAAVEELDIFETGKEEASVENTDLDEFEIFGAEAEAVSEDDAAGEESGIFGIEMETDIEVEEETEDVRKKPLFGGLFKKKDRDEAWEEVDAPWETEGRSTDAEDADSDASEGYARVTAVTDAVTEASAMDADESDKNDAAETAEASSETETAAGEREKAAGMPAPEPESVPEVPGASDEAEPDYLQEEIPSFTLIDFNDID